MDASELALRREVMEAFARTGRPPEVEDGPLLRALAERHVVVLDEDGAIRMAHPFARAPGGAAVEAADGRTWWGNCAWDGLGIVAALGLRDAVVTSRGVRAEPGTLFQVSVPARAWWDDIGFT